MRVVLAALVLLAGCDRCNAPEPTGTTGGSDGRRAAILEGTVRLAPGAEAPMWPENPLVLPRPRPALPAQCTPPQEADRRPITPGRDRVLPHIIVAIGDFSGEPEHEPVTHDLYIRDCRLTPPVVLATRGDLLRIHNETPDYHFMPDVGIPPLQALMSGNHRELELGRGGIRTLVCGFLAPCGRAEISVLYHPLHDLTDERGRFRIEGIPAGDEFEFVAWHPLFQDETHTLTLRAGERRTLDIVLEPAQVRAPPPPQDPPRDGPAEDHPDVLF